VTTELGGKIASAAYCHGFQAGIGWLLDRSRAVDDSDKTLWLFLARRSMGDAAGWGAAFALKQWREQREAMEATARAEASKHAVGAGELPKLLERAAQPGSELARRIIRTVKAARAAWGASS